MQCVDCVNLGIPEHLCMENKEIEVPFLDDEVLYRRHNEVIEGDISLIDLKIVERIFKMENDSHNRSLLSKPDDVLINDIGNKFVNYGIISLPVIKINEIPDFEIEGNKKKCKLEVVFVPTNCNYSHTEIWSYLDGVRYENGKPPKSARLYFRKYLLGIMEIIKQTSLGNNVGQTA